MDNNTFYFNRYITQKIEKIIRLIELVCCTICFVLSIIVFLKRLYFVTKVILMVVSTTFLFITLVDAVSWIQSRPMGHRIWVIFSVAAFHMFCLCGGFLLYLKRITNQRLLQATCAVNFITAHVYVVDCFLVIFQYIRWVHRNDTRVVPIKVQVDRAVSTCFMQEEWEYLSRRGTPRLRSTIRSRPLVVPTYSYGGTFAVSKDIPPLPTPEPLRGFRQRRMYCTLVNPYPLLEGSGDFRRTSTKIGPMETKLDLLAKDKTNFRKLSIYGEYRVEIHEPRLFSKVWSQSLLRKFRYLTMRSQSYGGEVSVFPAELSQKREEDTDAAEDSVVGNRKQTSREMIVAYCKPGGGNPPITMQDCVFHQYYQQPCFRCGKTHYQQQTTINGTLCCPPAVCTSSKRENTPPVQIIQIPCGNQACPGAQQVMQSPCGNPNCPSIQEYGSRRRYAFQQEPQVCPPCGRRYKPQMYAEEPPDDMYCVKECPRPMKCVEQCVLPYKCICGNGNGNGNSNGNGNTNGNGNARSTAVAETITEQEQLKNSEVMAVQEMEDKNVQMVRTTMEDNPQTSETRLVTASFLKRLLEGKCVSTCPGSARYSPEETTNVEDESSDRETSTEVEERERPVPSLPSPPRQRESRITKTPKPSKARPSRSAKKSQRLTAGGPIEEWEDGSSPSQSRENVTKSVPVIKTETVDSVPAPREETVRQQRSMTKKGSHNNLQIPSKVSYRDVASRGVKEEAVVRKTTSKRYQLQTAPSNGSVCECLIQGYPSKDCKKAKMRDTPSARPTGQYDQSPKSKVSYRVLPEQDMSDEAIGETLYEEHEKSSETLDEPVEEPPIQKSRAPSRLIAAEQPASEHRVASKTTHETGNPLHDQHESDTGAAQRSTEKLAREPSQRSRISQSSSESQKSPVREPSIKLRQASGRDLESRRTLQPSDREIPPVEEMRREDTTSSDLSSSQDEQQQVEGERIDSALDPGKKGNEEWCLKCCTQDTVKQKKKWCNFFKKKKK